MSEAAIILTNYRRPQNVVRQVKELSQLANTFDLFLVDNAARPDNLRNLVSPDVHVNYLESGTNLGARHRLTLSCNLPHDYVISIDDDIFLTEKQLFKLYDVLRSDARRVHGIWGQVIERRGDRLRLSRSLYGTSRPVDVINRVYGYTPHLAFRAVCIAGHLGFKSWSDIGPTDDILLSAASTEPPLAHEVGPLEQCETSDQVGIAAWRSSGFYQARNELIARLLESGYFPWAHAAQTTA